MGVNERCAVWLAWALAATTVISLGLVPPTEAKVALSSWSLAYIEPLVEAFNARNLGVEAEAVQLSPDQEHLRGAGPLLRQRPDGQRRVSGASGHA
jgi:hypothetical protein